MLGNEVSVCDCLSISELFMRMVQLVWKSEIDFSHWQPLPFDIVRTPFFVLARYDHRQSASVDCFSCVCVDFREKRCRIGVLRNHSLLGRLGGWSCGIVRWTWGAGMSGDCRIWAGCWVHMEQAMPGLWCGTCYPMYKELLPMTWPSLFVLTQHFSLFCSTFLPLSQLCLDHCAQNLCLLIRFCLHPKKNSCMWRYLHYVLLNCLQLVEMLLWQC